MHTTVKDLRRILSRMPDDAWVVLTDDPITQRNHVVTRAVPMASCGPHFHDRGDRPHQADHLVLFFDPDDR